MATPGALIGGVVVAAVALTVALDAWKLRQSHREITRLGPLPLGGHAWVAAPKDELIRNLINILTLTAMAVLPWPLARASDTPWWQPAIFSFAMVTMAVLMLLPKRYAVTRQALLADGWRVDWDRLRSPRITRGGRLILHRRAWGLFAPLPLGGEPHDLAAALPWVEAALAGDEAWNALRDASDAEQE